MKTYIDLTHPVEKGMPVWPGEPDPEIWNSATLEREGYRVESIRTGTHLGTHMDAPSHFIERGDTLDRIPLETLMGRAVILDFTGKGEGEKITRQDLECYEEHLQPGARVLIKTGWDTHFSDGTFFGDFPCLTLDGARYLASRRIALLGMDTPSPSPVTGDPENLIHKTLLGAGIIHVEALRNLTLIRGEECEFIVLPPLFRGFAGAPCRAVAILYR